MIKKGFLDYLYKQREVATLSVNEIKNQMKGAKTPEHFNDRYTYSVTIRDTFDIIIAEYLESHGGS